MNDYLRNHLVNVFFINNAENLHVANNINKKAPIEDVINQLNKVKQVWNRHQASLLKVSLIFGMNLNKAFRAFEFHKGAGTIDGNWDQFLKKNIHISAPYARKLREIARRFSVFKKFYNLGISFSEFYKRRDEIGNMLESDASVKSFWEIP